MLWCFGGQFLNRPWLVQVVDSCLRPALAVAAVLQVGAGTDELSKQTQTNNPQSQNQQAGHVAYASQVPLQLTKGVTLVYDIGRHITSNNGHGRYPRQDHIGQAGAWRGTSRTPPDHAGRAGARRGTSHIYVPCMTILVELIHSVPYIRTLLM